MSPRTSRSIGSEIRGAAERPVAAGVYVPFDEQRRRISSRGGVPTGTRIVKPTSRELRGATSARSVSGVTQLPGPVTSA
jgi:ribosomal protein L14